MNVCYMEKQPTRGKNVKHEEESSWKQSKDSGCAKAKQSVRYWHIAQRREERQAKRHHDGTLIFLRSSEHAAAEDKEYIDL